MSVQFDMQRLLSENAEQDVVFVVNNDQLESLLKTYFSNNLDHTNDHRYMLDRETYDRFVDLAMSSEYVEGQDFERVEDIEEMEGTTTSGAGAYLPSLHASPKKYKGPELKESEDKETKLASGKAKIYMKNKWGWKDAPSVPNRPSKAIVYKQLFERDKTKGVDANGKEIKIGDEVKVLNLKDGRGTVTAFEEDQVIINITKGGGSTHERPNTPMFPDNVEKIEKDDDKDLKEGFKKDIKVRNESQQLREAMKMVRKKLKEVNSILEYSKELKSGLQENECESCSRMMESMKLSIAEAYKKMKEL